MKLLSSHTWVSQCWFHERFRSRSCQSKFSLSTLIVSQGSHLLSFDCYRSSFEDLGFCQTRQCAADACNSLMTYMNFCLLLSVLLSTPQNRNRAMITYRGNILKPKILVANAP